MKAFGFLRFWLYLKLVVKHRGEVFPGPVPGAPNAQDAEMKLRKWLETIPIGNGSERGWDDGQIREIAEFANKRPVAKGAPPILPLDFLRGRGSPFFYTTTTTICPPPASPS